MTRRPPTRPIPAAAVSAALAAALAAPALSTLPAMAQSSPASAQCDQVMMIGTQHFPASVVAGCAAYFQALADGALAPGTFGLPVGSGVAVNLSTSSGSDN